MNEPNTPQKKILCNCPCKGPYCDSFTHVCDKPEEHYPQRDQAIKDIQNEYRVHLIEQVKKMESKQKIDNGHDCYEKNCDYCENAIKDEMVSQFLSLLEQEGV